MHLAMQAPHPRAVQAGKYRAHLRYLVITPPGGKYRAHQHQHSSRPPSVRGPGEIVGRSGLLACMRREASVLVLEPVELPRLDPNAATLCGVACNHI